MFTSQGQQDFMEIPSGVHGGFKVAKPSRFSNVQNFFKTMVNNGSNQFSSIPNNVPNKIYIYIYYSQSHILMEQILIGCSPDWKTFWKMKTKNKSKKRSKCFTNLTISAFT